MAFDIEHFPTSESAKRMLGMVSKGYYDNSYVAKWLFQVMGEEEDKLKKIITELPAQIFPETATWALRFHEEKWGLPTYEDENEGEPQTEEEKAERERRYNERRRRIIEKRDYVAPMTPYKMEQYIQGMTDYRVSVADVHDPGEFGWTAPHPNVFKVYLIADDDHGTVDSKAIHRTIDRIKQSHTAYTLRQVSKIIIDNTDLEHFDFRNIRIAIEIPFGSGILLDGRRRLDGSFLLNQWLPYRIEVRTGSRIKISHPESLFHLDNIALNTAIRTESNAKVGINNHIALAFWKAHFLDGRWILDGSHALDSEPDYSLIVRIGSRAKIENPAEKIHIRHMGLKLPITMPENTAVGINSHLEMNFWRAFFLDGRWVLDGRHDLDSKQGYGLQALINNKIQIKEPPETASLVDITKHTKDYWFMDGSLRLDGERKLNSVYKKEAVE